LFLTKRNLDGIVEFEGYKNIFLTTDNQKAIKNSDIIILAVQPAHIEGILEDMSPYLTEKHVLISTVTGFLIPQIEAIIGTDKYIIRAMPNTAIAVGKSMTCLCANDQGQKRIQ
jgi:pyrroline-5-carboxylate reductase